MNDSAFAMRIHVDGQNSPIEVDPDHTIWRITERLAPVVGPCRLSVCGRVRDDDQSLIAVNAQHDLTLHLLLDLMDLSAEDYTPSDAEVDKHLGASASDLPSAQAANAMGVSSPGRAWAD